MRLEHHLVGGYVRYISPHIIIITDSMPLLKVCSDRDGVFPLTLTPQTTKAVGGF